MILPRSLLCWQRGFVCFEKCFIYLILRFFCSSSSSERNFFVEEHNSTSFSHLRYLRIHTHNQSTLNESFDCMLSTGNWLIYYGCKARDLWLFYTRHARNRFKSFFVFHFGCHFLERHRRDVEAHRSLRRVVLNKSHLSVGRKHARDRTPKARTRQIQFEASWCRVRDVFADLSAGAPLNDQRKKTKNKRKEQPQFR